MRFAYCLNGSKFPVENYVPVKKDKAIKRGQTVSLVDGMAEASSTAPFIGVAAADHSGKPDPLNPGSDAVYIPVIVSPDAVYECDPQYITFTSGGTATTAIVTGSALASTPTADLIGSRIVCVSKGALSANKDGIGAIRAVTNYADATKTLSVEAGGVIGDGDVYAFIPKLNFGRMSMDAGCESPVISSTSSILTVVNFDMARTKYYVVIKSHYFK